MFIDQAEITVQSGRGGDGAVHFHREKFVPRGGPDGGDGGRGGDVILEVVPTLNTLSAFRYKTRYVAPDGARGGKNNMSGRGAKDLVIPVPPGTVIYDADTGELLGDLLTPGQTFLVAKGGRGGRGNQHFATSRNQAPQMGEKGEPSIQRKLRMELKLIADIGIVGVPNAGKSSLLARVTNATPKIADYPFTTLEPNLGVAELDMDHTLVLADIPGLVEGASQGVGLGHSFLRHIQRTRVIIHLLDGLSDDPLADFTQINSELALFDPALTEKSQLVVFNKMDIDEVRERWQKIKPALVKRGYAPMAISAVTGENVNEMLWKAAELLAETPVVEPVTELPVYRPVEDPKAFTITREEEGFRVSGAAIERAAKMTYWEYEGSVRRFQKLMETLGVEEALREKGIQEGDTVFVSDFELEWQE